LRCLAGDNGRRSGLLQLSFLAPLNLDILKISKRPGVVNKLGESARQAGHLCLGALRCIAFFGWRYSRFTFF
jgi:hypothetical protein